MEGLDLVEPVSDGCASHLINVSFSVCASLCDPSVQSVWALVLCSFGHRWLNAVETITYNSKLHGATLKITVSCLFLHFIFSLLQSSRVLQEELIFLWPTCYSALTSTFVYVACNDPWCNGTPLIQKENWALNQAPLGSGLDGPIMLSLEQCVQSYIVEKPMLLSFWSLNLWADFQTVNSQHINAALFLLCFRHWTLLVVCFRWNCRWHRDLHYFPHWVRKNTVTAGWEGTSSQIQGNRWALSSLAVYSISACPSNLSASRRSSLSNYPSSPGTLGILAGCHCTCLYDIKQTNAHMYSQSTHTEDVLMLARASESALMRTGDSCCFRALLTKAH